MRRLAYVLVLMSFCFLTPACKKHLTCEQIEEINKGIDTNSKELEAAIKKPNRKEAEQYYDAVEKGFKKLGKIDEVTCGSKVYKGSEEKERGEQYLKVQKEHIDKLPRN